MNTQFTQEDYDELYKFGCTAFVKCQRRNTDFLKKHNYSMDTMIKESVQTFLNTENIKNVLQLIDDYGLDINHFYDESKDDVDECSRFDFKSEISTLVANIFNLDMSNQDDFEDIMDLFFKLNVFKKIISININIES